MKTDVLPSDLTRDGVTLQQSMANAQHVCADCAMPTTPCKTKPTRKGGHTIEFQEGTWELYLVTDSVWKKAGMPKNGGGSLCVGCIEKRLGRKLVPQDFNFGDNGYNIPELSTPRLRSRMGLDPLGNIRLEG